MNDYCLLSTGMMALQSVSVGSRAVEPDFKKSNKKYAAQGAFCTVKAAADVLDGLPLVLWSF